MQELGLLIQGVLARNLLNPLTWSLLLNVSHGLNPRNRAITSN